MNQGSKETQMLLVYFKEMCMRRPIKLAVRGFYDLQQLRIQTGNRLVNHYLNKMGIEPGQKKSSTVNLITKQLEQEYNLITDGLCRVLAY